MGHTEHYRSYVLTPNGRRFFNLLENRIDEFDPVTPKEGDAAPVVEQ